jgi:predicted esterase
MLWLVHGACCVAQFAGGVEEPQIVYQVKPSQTDPGIKQFDAPSIIMLPQGTSATAQLLVFLPGTGEKPSDENVMLTAAAGQGYRVVGLEYDNTPAIAEVCPNNPSPQCSELVRVTRIFGEASGSPVTNTPAETIENRLLKLLTYLDEQHPNESWNYYLASDGPNWSHIVISGFSQGAGMAAYIAKKKSVARVVLFSSPFDSIGPSKALAPWISGPSATPADRWFGEYHKREFAADIIPRAYAALEIPNANIRVFDRDVPGQPNATGLMFHVSTTRNPAYEPDWEFLLGRSP